MTVVTGARRRLTALIVFCLVARPCHCTIRRLLQGPGTNSGPQFPAFQLPTRILNAANTLEQNAVPLTKANTGPLLGEKVFSDSLPVSAVNLGLGNNAFDKEQKPDLASTVAANVTLFHQQTFPDKCAQDELCTNITRDVWQYLLNELTDYGQGSADEALTNFTVGAANTTFYIVQPAGVGEIPTSVQTEIESWTPSPTPDPSSNIIAKLDKVAGGIQHLTGLSPSPGGFSAVLQRYFGDSKTTSGAAAAVAGAAGG
ncbi:g7616 [Coccomyxa viridis]|uniref:G7616 protein n=1 Tax=Coccomyxa viridis TaxID=1274662 RepID=A0ABP1FY96_9CHLO